MSDYTPPFNVNVRLLTFNLVQREQETKSIVTALEVDRHGQLYTMGSGIFQTKHLLPLKVISKHLLKLRRLPKFCFVILIAIQALYVIFVTFIILILSLSFYHSNIRLYNYNFNIPIFQFLLQNFTIFTLPIL